MRHIRVFSELSGQLKNSTQKRVLIEVALIKLTRPEMENKDDALMERIKNLENIVNNPSFAVRTVVTSSAASENIEEPKKAPAALFPARSEDVITVKTNWNKICNKLHPATKNFLLQQAALGNGGDNVLLILCNSASCFSWLESGAAETVKEVIGEELGCQMEIKLVKTYENPDEIANYDTMEDVCAIPITTED